MINSNCANDEEKGVLEAAHVVFARQKDQETKSTYSRVIKVISELMAAKDTHITGQGLTDAELIIEVYKHMLDQLSATHSKRYQMILDGAKRFYALLESYGGTYTAQEVADMLNISTAGVRKKMQRNKLLAVERGEHSVYPVWQFENYTTVDGFDEVLEALDDISSVSKVQFFLSKDPEYQATRIEYLKNYGPDDGLLRKALQLGKQGAA